MEIIDKKIVRVDMLNPNSIDDYHAFLLHNRDLRGEIIDYNQFGIITIEFHKRRN